MANVKITDLSAYTNPAATDVLPIVDVDTDVTKKVSVGEIVGKISGDVTVGTDGTAAITGGVIVNADVNTSAAIAGTKIDPDFGSQTVETTGVINAGSGTAAAPAVSVGTTDNGLYSPGVDQVAISTNGTGRLFVDNAGQVGLGSASSPVDDFHISTSNPSIVLEESDAGTNEKYWRTRVDNGAYIFEGLTDAFGSPSFWLRAFRATNSEQTDNIQFATSGSERLRITSAGLVGIGTSAPDTLLDVKQGIGSWVQITSIEKTSNGAGAAGGAEFIGSRGDGNDTFYGRVCLGFRRNDGTAIQSDKRIGGILFGGQHGTGTTYDADSMRYAAAINGVSEEVFTDANSMATGISFRTGNTGDDPRSPNKSYGTERVRITSTGNVGIGTTSPASPLHIGSSSSNIYALFDDGVNARFTFLADTTKATIVTATAGSTAIEDLELRSAQHIFTNTAAIERARIDSSGRLLVGTSTTFDQSAPLQVNSSTGYSANLYVFGADNSQVNIGSARGSVGSPSTLNSSDTIGGIYFRGHDGTSFKTGAQIQAQIDGITPSSDLPSRLVFSTTADGASSPTERMRIAESGYIQAPGIYNLTTASAANVFVNSNGVLYRSTSSIKYKTDIETLQDQYADAILNIRPVWYRSLNEQDNPDHSYWGFIAEEVAEIDPRLVHWKTTAVTYDENGAVVEAPCDPEPEGVAYDRFVPHLLNLIKRQQQAIETLEAKVTALESA